MLIGGSGTLALYGIRPNNDLDIGVTKRLFKKLSEKYPISKSSMGTDKIDVGDIEFFTSFVLIRDSIEKLIKNSITHGGFHFMSLEDLLRWKKAFNRDKDIKDIHLIEDFLEKNPNLK